MFGVGFEGLGGRGPWLRGMGVALHLTQGGFQTRPYVTFTAVAWEPTVLTNA